MAHTVRTLGLVLAWMVSWAACTAASSFLITHVGLCAMLGLPVLWEYVALALVVLVVSAATLLRLWPQIFEEQT